MALSILSQLQGLREKHIVKLSMKEWSINEGQGISCPRTEKNVAELNFNKNRKGFIERIEMSQPLKFYIW